LKFRLLILLFVLIVAVLARLFIAVSGWNDDSDSTNQKRCNDGPYFHIATCDNYGGLGSRFEKLMVGVTMASILNLTFVAPRVECWQSGHGVDARQAQQFFSWSSGESCSASDIELATAGVGVRVQTLSRKAFTKPQFDQLLKWHEPKPDEAGEARQLTARDASTDSERAPRIVRFLRDRLARLSGEQRRQTAFVVELESPFATHGSSSARLWARRKYSERFDASSSERTALHYFHGDYERAEARVLPPTTLDNADGDTSASKRLPLLNVAVHMRRGDALTATALRTQFRVRPMWWYATVCRQIIAAANTIARPRFFVFSEGNASDFDQFRRSLPQAHVVLGNERSVFADIDHMAHAHVLVGHVSSFSRLCAAISRRAAAVVMSPQPDPIRFRNNLLVGGNHLFDIDEDRAEFDFSALRAKIPTLFDD
jgi:hypothetical protein